MIFHGKSGRQLPLLSHQRSGQSPDVERMKATDAPVGFGEKMIYLYKYSDFYP
jgi:hypothetical protein